VTGRPNGAEALEGLDLAGFMREALAEADEAGRAGEHPIGAVLAIGGEIVARGRNENRARRSQLAHAELNALLAGGEALWERYAEAVLFTTVEPCPLCLGAAVMADVPHIVFALPDANVHSGHTVAENPYVRSHLRSYVGGVLEEEAKEVIRRYEPWFLKYITEVRQR
jgi:tRNA(adenine34) deaminase